MTRRWISAANHPTNFGGKSYGTLTLADALANSGQHHHRQPGAGKWAVPNVWWPRPSASASPRRWRPNASLALGTNEVTPVELTAAYAAFANGGHRVSPYMVTPSGLSQVSRSISAMRPSPPRVIEEKRQPRPYRHCCMAVGDRRHRRLCLVAWARGRRQKTGTTQDSHDAWFVGLHHRLCPPPAWVGNDDASPTRGRPPAATLPAYIWREAMGWQPSKACHTAPLDKSVQPPPKKTELVASGVQWGRPLG